MTYGTTPHRLSRSVGIPPGPPDGALDRAWTFDYVHLTNEMYTRYGEALLEVLRPFVQPRWVPR